MSLGKPGFGSGLGQPGVCGGSPPAAGGDVPLNLTNAEKLALPANTPVGTVVQVTDGYVVSGFGDARDGFYFPVSPDWAGEPQWSRFAGSNAYPFITRDSSESAWTVHTLAENIVADSVGEESPWLADWTTAGITLTHPAIQTLAAPSAAQGGVFMQFGTQEGVYLRDASLDDATAGFDTVFHLLGGTYDQPKALSFVRSLNHGAFVRWLCANASSSQVYYSLSDVATPDLAIDWKNASDDTPAGITVTSVSQGEIVAGLAVTNDGVTNGSSYVSSTLHGRQYYLGLNGGGSNNMHWDTDFSVWTDDVGEWTSDNVAFPWQGTDNGGGGHTGATFARNDVATEANWEVVP